MKRIGVGQGYALTRFNKRVNRGRDTREELGCGTRHTMDDAHVERDARPDSIKVASNI